MIAALAHVDRDVGIAAPHDDDVFDARGFLQRVVGHLLERNDSAAPVAAVGGDEQLCLRVVDPIAQRLGREAAEHDRVHRADAGAREHRDGELGDERHVERHAIALADAERLQHVRELADLPVEIEVGQRPAIAGLAFPDERRLVAAPGADVAIQAVGADVQLAADEPLRMRRIPVEDLGPRLDPLELTRELGPERLGILRRPRVDLGVRHVGRGAELGRGFERTILVQQRVDF